MIAALLRVATVTIVLPVITHAQETRPLRVVLLPYGAAYSSESRATVRQLAGYLGAELPLTHFRLVAADWVETVISEAGFAEVVTKSELLALGQVLRADVVVGIAMSAAPGAFRLTPTIVYRRDTVAAHAVPAAHGGVRDSVAIVMARQLAGDLHRRAGIAR